MYTKWGTRPASFLCGLLLLMALLGVSGCGVGGYNQFVGIDPVRATTSAGQSQMFRAQAIEGGVKEYSWKVKEGDKGGTVTVIQDDYSVNYTAPQTPGIYHVQVSGKYTNGSTKTATATVEVK